MVSNEYNTIVYNYNNKNCYVNSYRSKMHIDLSNQINSINLLQEYLIF